MPFVSVLMPTYNQQKYLRTAVESILTQTYSDFELLIIDDGSTDSTPAILSEYAIKDRRVRVISRENKGLCASLNELLAMAQGQLIARMDSDDISLRGRFASQVKFLQEHPEVVCVGGHIQLINEAGRMYGRILYPIEDGEIQRAALVARPSIAHPCFMMRRESVLAVGGYDATQFPAEDLDLILRLGEIGKLANLDEVILKYRGHLKSISRQLRLRQERTARAVCERACHRRGVTVQMQPLVEELHDADTFPQYQLLIKYGRWAFDNNDRQTAIVYGLRAVIEHPGAGDAWKFLAQALLKPFRVSN
jgi:glycosyltransferase involved in cell wall biosynthesis